MRGSDADLGAAAFLVLEEPGVALQLGPGGGGHLQRKIWRQRPAAEVQLRRLGLWRRDPDLGPSEPDLGLRVGTLLCCWSGSDGTTALEPWGAEERRCCRENRLISCLRVVGVPWRFSHNDEVLRQRRRCEFGRLPHSSELRGR